jgi:superfamily II DNA or RNA helicase
MTYPIATNVAVAVRQAISNVNLRPYQQQLADDIHRDWDLGNRNVLGVMPTGAGKTVVLSYIVQNHNGASCVIAHRQELTSQISLALARNGIRHRILGPTKLIRMIVALHMSEIGLSLYDPSARCAVAGVDTIMSRSGTGVEGDYYVQMRHDNTKWLYGPRENGYWGQPFEIFDFLDAPEGTLKGKSTPKDMKDELRKYAPTVTLWVTDEAHHCAANGGKRNKWMKATDLFTNAKGLGVTATPCRADGAGLGRHHDGVFDSMIIGPTMRYLIDNKFLTEYRIFAPPSNLGEHMSGIDTSKTTGDWNNNQVRDAVEHSSLVVNDDKTKIVGDVVEFYLKKFRDKLSVVFVPSVSTAKKLEKQFIDSGISAKALDGTTPDEIRNSSIRKFANREIFVLINVALFDEGFDLPAIEVVQDAYPTKSYGLFSQRFGRMLRLMEGKQFGIYSDHAGNVKLHGLPDAPRLWSLDRREKRGAGDDGESLRSCMNEECMLVYERYLKECPYCGTRIPEPTPTDRGDVEFVDGDLFELDAGTLAKMRGAIDDVDKPLQDAVSEYRSGLHCDEYRAVTHVKRFAAKHEAIQTMQIALREVMAEWAGYHRAENRDDSEIYRRFYLKYRIDWYAAMALGCDDAMTLIERVAIDIGVI